MLGGGLHSYIVQTLESVLASNRGPTLNDCVTLSESLPVPELLGAGDSAVNKLDEAELLGLMIQWGSQTAKKQTDV